MINEPVPEHSVFDAVPVPLMYASTTQRFINFIVDIIVVYALTYAFFYVLGMLFPAFGLFVYEHKGDLSFVLLDRILTSLMLALFYCMIEGAGKGRTLGKLITGTCAVNAEDGQPITWKQVFQRSFSRIVPFEPFSGLSGYPWHDKWSSTCVINTRAQKEVA